MKLLLTERINLLGILPKEGNFDTMKALRKFRESLALSESEKTSVHWSLEYKCPKCNIAIFLPAPVVCAECKVWVEPTGQAQWDTAMDTGKDVFIPETIYGVILATLGKMNDKGKLTENLLPLYEKFMVKGVEDGT